MNRDRVVGMFLGTAVGDALGMPVETFSPEKILEKYPETGGRVTDYILPTGHKWFDGRKAGTWTDDTQLTLAVARGLMAGDGCDMNSQIKPHVDALDDAEAKGWGGTTKQAIRNLANGTPWSKSGVKGKHQGKGNGVPMKVAPVAAYIQHLREQRSSWTDEERADVLQEVFTFLRNLTIMTHPTQMAVVASFAHTTALLYCLKEGKFNSDTVAKAIWGAACKAQGWYPGNEPDDLAEQLKKLVDYSTYDTDKARAEFGNGSCYCYHSIPFTHVFFLRNPHSIDALYDVVSAGGDADTNGSMLGAMLGALNGVGIFPRHLIDGLDQADMIQNVAHEFCDKFDIR